MLDRLKNYLRQNPPLDGYAVLDRAADRERVELLEVLDVLTADKAEPSKCVYCWEVAETGVDGACVECTEMIRAERRVDAAREEATGAYEP